MKLVTRYDVEGGHGWYVGSDAEVTLVPGEPEVWPGMFEAYCRMRGWGPDDFEFGSPEEAVEFAQDVRWSGSASPPR
jgi:hypothetical protein